jgi:hypothetical protein
MGGSLCQIVPPPPPGGGGGARRQTPLPPPPTHTHQPGFVTINAKTTVHCSPGSSMVQKIDEINLKNSSLKVSRRGFAYISSQGVMGAANTKDAKSVWSSLSIIAPWLS